MWEIPLLTCGSSPNTVPCALVSEFREHPTDHPTNNRPSTHLPADRPRGILRRGSRRPRTPHRPIGPRSHRVARMWHLHSMMRVPALLALVLTVGCTGTPAAAPSTAASIGVAPSEEPPPGELVLHVRRGCCYTEGSFFFVEVREVDGGTVMRRRYGPARSGFVLRQELEPGAYALLTFERPCEGACPRPFNAQALDPPNSRCRNTVRLGAGETKRVTVMTVPGHDCGTY
jgi:hypothetical protein